MKLLHTAISVALTLAFGFLLGEWLIGASLTAAYWSGREIAQAEYRWIERHGLGLRANMGWASIWTTPGIWSEKSWLWDVALPAVGSFGIAVYAIQKGL